MSEQQQNDSRRFGNCGTGQAATERAASEVGTPQRIVGGQSVSDGAIGQLARVGHHITPSRIVGPVNEPIAVEVAGHGGNLESVDAGRVLSLGAITICHLDLLVGEFINGLRNVRDAVAVEAPGKLPLVAAATASHIGPHGAGLIEGPIVERQQLGGGMEGSAQVSGGCDDIPALADGQLKVDFRTKRAEGRNLAITEFTQQGLSPSRGREQHNTENGSHTSPHIDADPPRARSSWGARSAQRNGPLFRVGEAPQLQRPSIYQWAACLSIALFLPCVAWGQASVLVLNRLAESDDTAPINVKAEPYNAVGDGSNDDTAEIQAAIDAAETSGRYVWFPKGVYKITSTIVVTTGGAAGSAKSVSLIGAGTDHTRLSWAGATDGTALRVTYNKNFSIEGINVANTVARGTTIGIHLTGPSNIGTQTTHGVLRRCALSTFNIGVSCGDATGDKAASEVTYDHCTFHDCDYGWKDHASTPNSLNHIFYLCYFYACGYGIHSEVCNFSIYGGGAGNSVTADIKVTQTNANYVISGFRSENSALFLYVQGGQVDVTSAFVNPSSPVESPVDQVTQVGGLLKISTSIINGRIRANNANLQLHNCYVDGDSSSGLPFFTDAPSYMKYDVSMCSPYDLIQDNTLRRYYDEEKADWTNGYPVRFRSTKGSGSEYTSHIAQYLYRVKALSSGAEVQGNNLRRQVTFATSGTVVVDFARTVTAAITATDHNITVAAGGITKSDLGERVQITGAGASGGLFDSFVTDADSTTVFEVHAPPTITNASINAIIGEDEPDAEYMVTVGGSANETFWITNKATTGFTVNSSNASSTATVDLIIAR
jgi:hypothetical protein